MTESENRPVEGIKEPPVCPECGEKTRTGNFKLGQTWRGLLFSSGSYPHLFFNEPAEPKTWGSVLSLRENWSRPGWYCPACGFAMVKGVATAKAAAEEETRQKADALINQPPRDEWWKKYY